MEGLFMGVLRAWHQNRGGAERAGEMDKEKQQMSQKGFLTHLYHSKKSRT